MLPTWPEGTRTEKCRERNGVIRIIPLIQLNTGAPLGRAKAIDLDICILWAEDQRKRASKEDAKWWVWYVRLVVRQRNSICEPRIPMTKAQVQADWDRRVKWLLETQASYRDIAIAHGIDPVKALMNYNQIVLINRGPLDKAFAQYLADAPE